MNHYVLAGNAYEKAVEIAQEIRQVLDYENVMHPYLCCKVVWECVSFV